MIVYELTHLFFRDKEEIVYSPKGLGLYRSHQSAADAIDFYCTQPGFKENIDAFSIRERTVIGNIENDTVYEVLMYFYSPDYETEATIDLGLHPNRQSAEEKLEKYRRENLRLTTAEGVVFDAIINRCVIDEKQWLEGFVICMA